MKVLANKYTGNPRSLGFLLVLFFLSWLPTSAQMPYTHKPTTMVLVNDDDIVGTWFNDDSIAIIVVYKHEGMYFGQLVWRVDSTKLDNNNPFPHLRTRKRIGLEVLKDATFDGKDSWEHAVMYDPSNGHTYSARLTMHSRDKLELTGYVIYTRLGRGTTWYRVKPIANQ